MRHLPHKHLLGKEIDFISIGGIKTKAFVAGIDSNKGISIRIYEDIHQSEDNYLLASAPVYCLAPTPNYDVKSDTFIAFFNDRVKEIEKGIVDRTTKFSVFSEGDAEYMAEACPFNKNKETKNG